MNAISGTLRTYSVLRDGTLRVVVDVDPQYKTEFHQLFQDIDLPVGIAPLVPDFERLPQEPEKPKGGALCKLAAMWCKDDLFQEWLSSKHQGEVFSEEDAAQWVRNMCSVDSRSELDNDEIAAEIFQKRVRIPYMNWKKGKGE